MKSLREDLPLYRRLRKVLRGHQNAIVRTIPRSVLVRSARRFGLLKGNKLLLESEDELSIFMDFCIYSCGQRGRNLVERYLASLPASQDADEQVVRRAMLFPRFSVFRVEQADLGVGINVCDLIRGDWLFVVDEALGSSAKPGLALALRLIRVLDCWMTTGAGFPVSEAVVEESRRRFPPRLKVAGGSASVDFLREDEATLAAFVIRAGLAEGTTSKIGYV